MNKIQLIIIGVSVSTGEIKYTANEGKKKEGKKILDSRIHDFFLI